jgi:hypothetical protein
MIDPYPADLAKLDELPTGAGQVTEADRLIRAVNRLAQALEQNTLAILDHPQPAAHAPLTALPPVQTPASNSVCPIHGTPWKLVPAGISKKTGNAYEAFRACSTKGCDQRPR